MTDFSLGTVVSIGLVREAEDHPLKSVVLFSAVGLVVSLCLMALGVDLSAGWI
jgi:hypothetical protein